jgi:hypothetical protein
MAIEIPSWTQKAYGHFTIGFPWRWMNQVQNGSECSLTTGWDQDIEIPLSRCTLNLIRYAPTLKRIHRTRDSCYFIMHGGRETRFDNLHKKIVNHRRGGFGEGCTSFFWHQWIWDDLIPCTPGEAVRSCWLKCANYVHWQMFMCIHDCLPPRKHACVRIL